MKKLLVILFSLSLTLGATAQKIRGGGFHGGYARPRVTVVAPVVPLYPTYGFGLGYGYGYGYSPFYDPFYGPRYAARPTQLDLQIEDIKNDYGYRISSVKDDKSLPKDERKQKVRDLKHERDQEIIDAKRNYYHAKDDNRAQSATQSNDDNKDVQ